MRVLVVEDHPRLAETVATVLRREGIAVDVAFDGREALGRVALADYDVVVLDRDLPGVHGDEVCRAMVADRRPSRVLMLTAAGTLEDRVRGPRHRRRRLSGQAFPPRRAGRSGPGAVAALAPGARSDPRARRPGAGLRSPSGDASGQAGRAQPEGVRGARASARRRRRGRLERAVARAGLGRRGRSVHEHGPDDGQPAPGQARRPAGDRDRHARRLPDRRFTVTPRATRSGLAARMPHPKTTVRWRLTLLYGGLFLACGAALLAITYTLVDHATVTNAPFTDGGRRSGPGAAERPAVELRASRPTAARARPGGRSRRRSRSS